MELKVGMYIRSKDKNGVQYIRKIVELPEETRYGSIVVDKDIHNVFWVSKKNVLKVSFNLIDLIEVGDYINGLPVTFVYIPDGVKASYFLLGTYQKHFINEDIKDIVTKEQFDACKYVVERNK